MHSNVTIKNVSWPHFSWATMYVTLSLFFPVVRCILCELRSMFNIIRLAVNDYRDRRKLRRTRLDLSITFASTYRLLIVSVSLFNCRSGTAAECS